MSHLPGSDGSDLLSPPSHGERTPLLRRIRVVRRGISIVVWTLPCMIVQAVCLLLPGRPKVAFARFFWATFTRLMGLRVRVVGELASGLGPRPVVYVSNHSSWVDIPVVGGVLPPGTRSSRVVAVSQTARAMPRQSTPICL